MKIKSLMSALTKNGLTVEIDGSRNNLYVVNGSKYQVSFYNQEGNAICLHARRYNDTTDLMTDYHAGFFVHTIKEAVSTALEQVKS